MATETKISKSKPSLDVYKQSFREYLVRHAILTSLHSNPLFSLCLSHFSTQRETDAVKDEVELGQLMQLLHEPLPVSFRLNLHRSDVARCLQFTKLK